MLREKLKTLMNRQKQQMIGRDYVILSVGVALFVTVAMATIAQSSVWFDESFSAYIIRFSFTEIWHYTSLDVHPPLYYWFLKVWSLLFGTTDIALRSMSVFFGGVAVVFGYLLLHRAFGRKAAVYGLLALVLSPILIRYSQEMRMYTMVLAAGLAATYTLLHAIETGKRRLWVMYGVLLAAGMWIHYFAAIIWLAHWAWYALMVQNGKKHLTARSYLQAFFSKEWILAHVVAIGLYAPWLPYLVKQLLVVQSHGFWIPPVSPVTLTNFFTGTVMYQDQNGLTPWLTLVFLVLVPTVVWLSVRGFATLSRLQKTVYLLLVAVAFMPPILLIVTSMPPLESSFVDRYLVASSVVIAALMGLALWFSTRILRSRFALFAVHILVVGSLVIGVTSVYHYGNYNKINGIANTAKQIIAEIDDVDGTHPVLASNVWSYYDVVFYETDTRPVSFVDAKTYEYGSLEMLRTQSLNKVASVNEFLDTHTLFWYVGIEGDRQLQLASPRVQEVQRLSVNDPVTGAPGYQAVQYRVIAE